VTTRADTHDMFRDLLLDRYGSLETFLATQSCLRPSEALWAVQHPSGTVPMPSFAHAQRFASSSGGELTTWDGDRRSHAAALAKLHANADPETLAWLTGPA
jgi:hypothetical protein